ncbi:hypothetical protein C1H46_008002 [Malus baccata]|uniref:Uncharacterized protein n=1 Tax=Malus baccata TaxID=106549 RepID=A0A540N5P1_MALBA|nr:hypothetical protein C1H46_008002 [Malus baccata]
MHPPFSPLQPILTFPPFSLLQPASPPSSPLQPTLTSLTSPHPAPSLLSSVPTQRSIPDPPPPSSPSLPSLSSIIFTSTLCKSPNSQNLRNTNLKVDWSNHGSRAT